MAKRGQFFLLAAFVIVSLIIGLQAIYTSINTSEEDVQVYDLSNEINFEGRQVIQQGVFNAVSDTEILENVQNITDVYSSSNPDKEFLFVYGNESEVNVIAYEVNEGSTFGVGTGGEPSTLVVHEAVKQLAKSSSKKNLGDSIRVILNKKEDVAYTFDLKTGNNFFMIISKEENNERAVISN